MGIKMAILHIAVAVKDRGPGRVKEGDIVCAKPFTGTVGKKTRKNVIWLKIDTDLTPDELMRFEADENPDGSVAISDKDGQGKRRYGIDLRRILNDNGLDFSKALDEDFDYQPLINHTEPLRNPQKNKRILKEKEELDADKLVKEAVR